MVLIKKELEKNGVSSIIPKEEDEGILNLSEEEFSDFKRKVSMQYLAKIRDASCLAILVVNNEKHGKSNYIGTNTIVEISMAFCWGRPIFLYNGLYETMKDELIAWGVRILNGNLSNLIAYYKNYRYIIDENSKYNNEVVCLYDLGNRYRGMSAGD